jgi:glycosyltransferase involved in cell wall biosynthesis
MKTREQDLLDIYRSKAWRLVLLLRRIRVWLIPPGSRRERFAHLLIRTGRTFRNDELGSFLLKAFNKLRQIARLAKPSVGSMVSFLKAVGGSRNEYVPKEEIYVPIREDNVDPMDVTAKIIAFYLPQFHPIPENDAWWGKGFTEWINVSKAVPNFVGHYQPHFPGELGYYDLRLLDVQEQQVALAKKYGIYGFCFYYYWFHGKRLLERPINQYLANPHLDLPFCLCWANENWTRRWDGADHDILIAQDYNEEQYRHFIRDISVHFSDPRYIRVDEKPMLLVYRVNLLPDAQKAAEIWRSECRMMGIGEIYLVAVQSFGITDPRPYGFDAAVEFPPSYLGEAEISPKTVKITNPNFKGKIFDYNLAVRSMLNKKHGDYTYFKSVMPSWDNTARRQNDAHIFINSSPAAYQEWLEKVVAYSQRALPEDKRFIFVNAWNEWAEGTHLEPDRRYGYAYLHATADAITKKKPASAWTILFVSHDANKGGAQEVLINVVAWFKRHTNINVKVLCLQGGGWLHRFTEIADTLVLEGPSAQDGEEAFLRQIERFCEGIPDLIYGNTVVAGSTYGWLRKLNVPILTHFHELESSIRKYGSPWIENVINLSSHFIACSVPVRENLIRNYGVPSEKISTVYESIVSRQPEILDKKSKLRQRKKFGLKRDATLIFGCGIGMPFRKGADLFIQLGETLLQKGYQNFHLYWIGDFDPAYQDEQYGAWKTHYAKLKNKGLSKHVTFLGMKDNPREYLACGDIFLLSSREDPFPLVALEAADCGLPIVCFAETGGIPDFVGDDAGFVAPREDLNAMAEKLIELAKHEELRLKLGERAREKLLSRFTVEQTTPHILSVCRKVANKKPAVSVIVPNYNHERYLEERLNSIFNQSFKDFEVILLDDASTDKSMDVLMKYAHHADVQIVPGKTNSGSPFKQWLKGIDMATSDILWIAESDDICDLEFLKTLLPAFDKPKVKLAYANSHIIDENGRVVGDYINTEYLSSLSPTKWNTNYQVTAEQEINDGLGVKNTILNISAALIRRFEMSREFRETLQNMRIAGDWYFIVNAIRNGIIGYDARKLNSHRRHSSSVIAQTVNDKKLQDFYNEFYIVHDNIVKNYRLRHTFAERWEGYMRKQWDDFSKDRPFDEIFRYYPFEKMKNLIKENTERRNFN